MVFCKIVFEVNSPIFTSPCACARVGKTIKLTNRTKSKNVRIRESLLKLSFANLTMFHPSVRAFTSL